MKQRVIKDAVAPVHREPHFESEMITQALLGETVHIHDRQRNWYNIEQLDGYRGWIHKFYTDEREYTSAYWQMVTARSSKIRISPQLDASVLLDVSMGSSLAIESWKTNSGQLWMQVRLPDQTLGWLPAQPKLFGLIREQIIQQSHRWLGAPYLWGGKTVFGCDCSGFIQTVFKSCGINIPRDTSDQYALLKDDSVSVEDSAPGDLFFFRSSDEYAHIAIAVSGTRFIHAMGAVKTNDLSGESAEYDSELAANLVTGLNIRKLL